MVMTFAGSPLVLATLASLTCQYSRRRPNVEQNRWGEIALEGMRWGYSLTAAIWHNHHSHQPVHRSPTSYDH